MRLYFFKCERACVRVCVFVIEGENVRVRVRAYVCAFESEFVCACVHTCVCVRAGVCVCA